ncbi:TonB-dependent receptor [Asticcacaulis sp. DXS10W]|uniref:TonB-dependent receptor n=1 Tax=Asticcacaulis currens TaxID=2984210 RepID=A0ABT5IG52_9CAUL|nr:TonB-dependent receptor [Asticcacaulis currens]
MINKSKRSGLMVSTTLCGALLSAMALTAVTSIVPQVAMAQSAVGTVYGKAAAGETVTLTDKETGVANTSKANASGDFSFAQLPPGEYTVKLASGKSVDVTVVAGSGALADFSVTEVVVRGSRSNLNRIDVKSTESTTILTASQIENLPVTREISAVALLAPGTLANGSPDNFGNTVSVGGSSVAENGYYINGFDVTNIRTFLSYANLSYDAVGQQQVKTGGYGAEFGRSLGGVISVVTKRGTNQWRYGGSVTYAPSEWDAKAKDAVSIDPAKRRPATAATALNPFADSEPDKYLAYRSANRYTEALWTNWVSGPIIEDKLFMFASLEKGKTQTDTFGVNTSKRVVNTSPTGLLKLDYYLTPKHHFEYTGILNKSIDKVENFIYTDVNQFGKPMKYVGAHQAPTSNYDVESGGYVHVLKYTGEITDNLTLSLMGGKLHSVNNAQNPAVANPAAAQCVAAYDSRGADATALNFIGCWDEDQFRIPDLKAPKETDERKAYRADVDWRLGNHTVRFGYDSETFESSKRGEIYSGGQYWRYYQRTNNQTVSGVVVPAGTLYGRLRVYQTGSVSYKIENSAFYIEDSWQITPTVLLYGGLRSESFSNYNSSNERFVHADNTIAPRLGFSWDVNGDSSFKVFGNFGRYYIPVASNTNIRASGIEWQEESFYRLGGVNTATGAPTSIGAQIGTTSLNGSKTAPKAASVASENLEPMFQDEFILGAQKKFTDELTLGLRATYRKVQNGFDDHCTYSPYQNWAKDKGYTNFDYHDVASCQIINPGKDVVLEFDNNSTGTATQNTIPASYFKLPEYDRAYAALELFGSYNIGKLNLNGSYTLSKSYGNSEGYVNTTLGQVDAGLVQDFDNYLFEVGSRGLLPNDRTHSLKLFGNYRLTEEFNLGGFLQVTSGRPINCTGYVDTTDPTLSGEDAKQLALYSASSFFCSRADGTKYIAERGTLGRTPTSVVFNTQVQYRPNWANNHVAFYLDVSNLFNSRETLTVQESSQRGGASSPQYDPDYGRPLSFQTPRSARLTMRYNF